MTQTAVQWLNKWFMDNPQATVKEADEAFDQAKVMETEQIIDAWNDGFDKRKDEPEADAFGYWNQTYGGKP
jgi:hypothetical protein